MVHTCSICNYQTTRAFDYDRHMAKKKPCRPKLYRCVDDSDIAHIHENRNAKNEKMDDTGPCKQCSKCLKIFSQAYHMRSHQIKCDGFDKKQCTICLLLFTSAQGKSKHSKYVKCNPVQKVNGIQEKPDNKGPCKQCSKCSKIFSQAYHMRSHQIKCDGFDKKQCKVCLRLFTTSQGKTQHMKYVKCNPPKTVNCIEEMVPVHVEEDKLENRLAQDTIDGILNTIQNYKKMNHVASSCVYSNL